MTAICTDSQLQTVLGLQASDTDWGMLKILQPIADQMIADFLGFQVIQQQFTEWYPDRQLQHIRDELIDSAPYEMIGGRAVQYGQRGVNNQVIQLRQLPVRSIAALYENPGAWTVANPPSFPADTLLQEGLDYVVDWREPDTVGTRICWTGEVTRLTGAWFMSPWTGRTVQVTYTAGFTQDELTAGPWPQFCPRVQLASMQTLQIWTREFAAWQRDKNSGASGGPVVSESLAGWSVSYDAKSVMANLGRTEQLPVSVMKILEPFVRMTRFF